MKQFFLTFAGVFAALLLFFVAIPVVLIGVAVGSSARAPTPANTVLSVDLRGGLTDQPPTDPLAAITGAPLSVGEVVNALRHAQDDGKIKSLVVRLPEAGMDPAAADELAQAFRRFRSSGKTIYAHSQGLYASGMVTSTYMLGAAANELWMQPGAPFEATGLSSEEIFLARFFERFGIDAQFEQREQYKNAVNTYLYPDFTAAHREAQLGWMNAIFDSTLSSVGTDRKMQPQAVRAALVAGPYDAAGALAKGLIDKTGQVEDMQAEALKAAGDGSDLMDVSAYSGPARIGRTVGTIALINVEGAIVTGQGGVSLLGETSAGSDLIAGAIRDAAKDDGIKAIVLRVSSPGGADTASEQIAAAVRAAKAAGKPVVVSMGTYAASGGYWISAEADYIVAQPTTLTGSIGVYGGKISAGEGAARYGIDLKQVTVGGEYAGMGALGAPMTETQRAAYAAQIDRVYASFIANVARGRHIPAERVRQIAGGRVWTGVQAQRLGLVDELGGLTEALDKAKALAGLNGVVRVKTLPEPISTLQALQQMLGVSATSARTLAAVGWLMGDARAQAVLNNLIQAKAGVRASVLAPQLLPQRRPSPDPYPGHGPGA